MKIEAGKYYKRRDGKLAGVAERVQGAYQVRCGGNYYNTDGYFYDSTHENGLDLVEEVNADGSPIGPVETAIGGQRRQEIALQILTAMIASPPVCNRAEVDKAKWCGIAFEWADEFIKESRRED